MDISVYFAVAVWGVMEGVFEDLIAKESK